jgi:hypothetical protein
MTLNHSFRSNILLPAAWSVIIGTLFMTISGQLGAQPGTKAKPESKPSSGVAARSFQEVADEALLAMKNRAEELHIQGVAVVAYFTGDSIAAWSSKMVVVGSMKKMPSQNDKDGANLLAIAYSKASEMADTLKDSGSGVRPPMTGEFGWQGGVVAKGQTGYLIATFSGGPSEDDVKVSRAGLEILTGKL